MSDIIMWGIPEEYAKPIVKIPCDETVNTIEWSLPSGHNEMLIRRRLANLETGYEIWHELNGPYSRYIRTWLTSTLRHALDHRATQILANGLNSVTPIPK